MGRGCVSLLPASAVMLLIVCSNASAQDRQPDTTLFEAALPGGIQAALATLGDRTTPDRSQFLLEVIRRFYSNPLIGPADQRLAPVRALAAQLDAAPTTSNEDTLPLPLPPEVWTQVVFAGRPPSRTLVSAILQSRNASLLYCALLSLDEATRAWLMGRRDLLAYLTSHAGVFLVAAPGIRVNGGRLDLPGGDRARPAWLALARVKGDEPEQFIRNLVEARDGRVAYVLGAMSQLTPEQLRFAMRLDLPDSADRVREAQTLYGSFEQVATSWDLEARPFWRPARDPALLASDLRTDERGVPSIPGNGRFWSLVFDGSEPASGGSGGVTFGALCDRVFRRASRLRTRDYDLVLFASRHAEWLASDGGPDVVDTIRAAAHYPALTATLERAGLTDVAVFAAAARRAAVLDGIRDEPRASRALAQFQGALALVTRAAMRGSLSQESLTRAVLSLSSVETSRAGDYEGRLVRWIESLTPGPDAQVTLDERLVQLASGAATGDPFPQVEWEGTRYRVDFSHAESDRLARLFGDQPYPNISTARSLVRMAETLGDRRLSVDGVRAAAATFDSLEEARAPFEGLDRFHDARAKLREASRMANVERAGSLAPALRVLADSFLARGLLELAYAVALGQPGATVISVSEAASRHAFGTTRQTGSLAWQLPDAGAANEQWQVRGSLLGLDVRLASFSLRRVSLRPPPRPPALDDVDREVFTEAVALVAPRALSDTPRERALAALTRGRARVASARSVSDVLTLVDLIRLSPARRTLLSWAMVHDLERVAASFSLSELLWLGAEGSEASGGMDGWGAPAEPRLGCLCLRFIDRRPWEVLAGRWGTGIFATGFPDLNLRLDEHLQALHMPATLLAPVLAAATVDFVENVNSRDPDDRRSLVEFVQGLKRERVEEYLALLTTDGPLVPIGEAANAPSRPGRPR